MSDVYVVGVGMIRFNKYPDKTVRGMAAESVDLVLNDAGLDKGDLQAAYVSNTFWGMFSNQHSIRGEIILRDIGIGGIPVVNCENACAGASTAFHLGYTAIRAGMYDAVLVLGSEKITHSNKAISLGAYASCMDVENFDKSIELFEKVNRQIKLKSSEGETSPGEGRSIFMDVYAMGARWHMSKFGSTQRQLAAICAKNHWHGSLNPLAQYQKNMTVEEVLADKPIAYPFTRSMCAPVGDGATAAILCSTSYLKKMKDARPVKVLASVLGSGEDRDLDGIDIGERLSQQAYNTV
ncbi:MAG: thiolase family protein [Desulfobacteraceae bacterium]|nr:thiolase family protein [Desulfobacteraceae bacterium]MBC2756241.1 thiolase family protein [Desulfobacteraceae bacterium]